MSNTEYSGLCTSIIAINLGGGEIKEKFLFAATNGATLLVSCDFAKSPEMQRTIIDAGVTQKKLTEALKLHEDPTTPRENLEGTSANMRVIAQVPIVAI